MAADASRISTMRATHTLTQALAGRPLEFELAVSSTQTRRPGLFVSLLASSPPSRPDPPRGGQLCRATQQVRRLTQGALHSVGRLDQVREGEEAAVDASIGL